MEGVGVRTLVRRGFAGVGDVYGVRGAGFP